MNLRQALVLSSCAIASLALSTSSAFAQASSSTLIALDFNEAGSLPALEGKVAQNGGGTSMIAQAEWNRSAGVIEEMGTTTPTGAIELRLRNSDSSARYTAGMRTGLIPVQCDMRDANLLTLAFDMRTSAARPVGVFIESFDAQKNRTGGLKGVVYPAAPAFYHRHVLDLGTMTANGSGAFNTTDPFVQITFTFGSGHAWPIKEEHYVQIDNLSYCSPAIYVSATGNDGNDGKSIERSFKTIQKSIDVATAGDIIMVGAGEYSNDYGLANFRKSGKPAAWIVLRNLPGQKPVLRSTGWNGLKIGRGDRKSISSEPATAYIEIRGLTLRGYDKEIEQKYKDKIGKIEGETNSNGISIDGRFQRNKPHHVRIADCEVFEFPGGGISVIHSDRVSIENNRVYENCHWTVFAGSGISIYQPFNFEATTNEYRMLVRNNTAHDNYCTQPWVETGALSDGNGLIFDDYRNLQNQSTNGFYSGRTLVQNNVSFRNGGSGMHAFQSDRIDFVNNTVFGNNSVMDYSQMGLTRVSDGRMLNNIIVATTDKAINRVNGDSTQITISNNLIWGGNGQCELGDNAIEADPMFIDVDGGDFRLRSDSPAIGRGRAWDMVPIQYQNGTERDSGRAQTLGALPVAH